MIAWFSVQTHWAFETRRSYRTSAMNFFSWLYASGRVPVYLGDALPKVRCLKGSPRPAPHDAWAAVLAAVLAAADPRVTLMLRLAGEAGLRRAEVAQVRTNDVFVAVGSAQLIVRGKGGKQRLVPISSELAEFVRRGAAGHTPEMGAYEWGKYGRLFLDGEGGHLTARWVGTLVSRVMPEGHTMHTLRHRFAMRVYRGSRNLRAVQALMGHSSVATTEIYTASRR